jgi:uncharacterized protein YcfL
MKKLHLLGMAAIALVFASCGSSKNMAVQSNIEKQTSLEGEKVVVETTKLSGIEMVDALSEDGTKMVKVPYKWYAGIGKANDKQTAIEMAEMEARATISRIIENAVDAKIEESKLAVDGEVHKAIAANWTQVSKSIQNGCEPFGDTKVEYSPSTKMYTATAKVGIRGDKYQQLLNNAGNYKPAQLSQSQMDEFIQLNQSIMNAAKGN